MVMYSSRNVSCSGHAVAGLPGEISAHCTMRSSGTVQVNLNANEAPHPVDNWLYCRTRGRVDLPSRCVIAEWVRRTWPVFRLVEAQSRSNRVGQLVTCGCFIRTTGAHLLDWILVGWGKWSPAVVLVGKTGAQLAGGS